MPSTFARMNCPGMSCASLLGSTARTRTVPELGVTMPICEQVAAVLFEGRPVAEALAALLAREPRPEEERAPRA